MPIDELRHQLTDNPRLQLIDVRRPAEFTSGHIAKAVSSPLAHLEEHVSEFDPDLPTAVICGSGFRSSAATSILSKHRFKDLYNVVGGMTAWNNATASAPNTCAANPE